MCRELEERATKKNIDLGFNKFVKEEQDVNANQFIKMSYIRLQFFYSLITGKLMPDDLAISTADKMFVDSKKAGLFDILNRCKQL